MSALKSLLITTLMLGGLAGGALAADPIEPAPQPDTQPAYDSSNGFYVRGDLGWSFLEWGGGADDSAFSVGGGVGFQATDYMRADLRADWSGGYDVAPGASMDATTVLGNLYFDWKNETAFTPYVGAGLGWGWLSDMPGGGDDNGFAYALMGGAAVDLSEMLAVDVGYRFRDIGVTGPDFYDHSVTAGLRVKF